MFSSTDHRKNGPTSCILSTSNKHLLIPSKILFPKKSLNVSLRSKRFRSSYWSSSLLSNFRVKLARKRLLRRLLQCCPTIPSMISWIRSYIILVYHWFSLDLQAPTPAIYLHADLVPYFLATGLAGNLLCRPVKKKY